ncbi:hypothetical protein, partial [Streptomyces hawaiiensis]|uniref:hypothetical protein n=1 Tax=Streptomyces hawaiiensis TaxID=67305 RepID=UPI003667AF48
AWRPSSRPRPALLMPGWLAGHHGVMTVHLQVDHRALIPGPTAAPKRRHQVPLPEVGMRREFRNGVAVQRRPATRTSSDIGTGRGEKQR